MLLIIAHFVLISSPKLHLAKRQQIIKLRNLVALRGKLIPIPFFILVYCGRLSQTGMRSLSFCDEVASL